MGKKSCKHQIPELFKKTHNKKISKLCGKNVSGTFRKVQYDIKNV